MMKWNAPSHTALACIGLVAASVVSQPTTVTYTDSHALSRTNWMDTLEFPKFNPDLGELTCVKVALMGEVFGSGEAENRDAEAANITLDLRANITLNYPNPPGGTLVNVIPVVSQTYSVTSFDGTIDFGGTSGVMTGDLTATDMDMTDLSANDFGLFTGTGTITLPLEAEGASVATGPGNLTSGFSTQASADAEITYCYEPVPEGSTTLPAMIAAGLLLALGRSRYW